MILPFKEQLFIVLDVRLNLLLVSRSCMMVDFVDCFIVNSALAFGFSASTFEATYGGTKVDKEICRL